MNWLDTVITWLTGIWLKFQRFVKLNVRPAIILAETLKFLVDNPTADLVVSLTKTPLDDMAIAALRKYIPTVLAGLKISEKCSQLEDADDQLRCYIEEIRKLPIDLQQSMLHRFASRLAVLSAAGERGKIVPQKRADLLTQMAYTFDSEKGRLLPNNGLSANPNTGNG
jgi:hypothetical protein